MAEEVITMKSKLLTLVFLCLSGLPVAAQEAEKPATPTLDAAAAQLEAQLQAAIDELNQLREQQAAEKVPMSRKLRDLEADLVKLRQEFQSTNRVLEGRTLDLTNTRNRIKSQKDEVTYLSTLLNEYVNSFDSRLHIAEVNRYKKAVEFSKLAPENDTLSNQQVFEAQAALLGVSLDRLNDCVGGTRFEGTAVDPSGAVQNGSFIMIGPSALFRSADGQQIGTVEQRLGSLEPNIVPFKDPLLAGSASQIILGTSSVYPLDPTLGNAHKVEATEETLWEHIKKGGPIMWPIFVLAGAALLVVLYKWLALTLFLRRPKKKQVAALMEAIAKRDDAMAQREVKDMKGPMGAMLRAGITHLRDPRELMEEVMYEQVLSTKLKLNSFLPFVAISASAAPLLGLLGTVTGIMNTFTLITVFGTGDVKTLSSGISEALITTEYGLIVAIPSLLLHALLSRKARNVVDDMEKTAVTLFNEIGKADAAAARAQQPQGDWRPV
jgi:biopolymer transport protein ExbB